LKISLKVEYACRVLARLAKNQSSQVWSHTEDLASDESIPPNYLVQILSELRNGGLIASRRGKAGGYSLMQPPGQITLLQIVRVVDREMLDARVQGEGGSGRRVSAVWEEISRHFQEKLEAFTLEDFLREDQSEMYYI
jgi:Rrf2 family cysteine metabolism transcriptional repressor